MKRRRWPIVAVVIGVGLIALLAGLMFWPTDRSRLQGPWVGHDSRLTFEGDLAVMELANLPPSRTYYRLDHTTTPPRITVIDADAPAAQPPVRFFGYMVTEPSGHAHEECRGIFELQGDRLRIGLAPAGADYPTSFDSPGVTVFELRRE